MYIDMEEKILEILSSVLGVQVDETCSQANCAKWNSINQLNIVVELEMEFNISLEPEEIGEMKSYNDIIRILKTKQ